MKTKAKLISAITAAVLMLAGCGPVENAASVTDSQDNPAPAEGSGTESTAGTAEGSDQDIRVAEGFEKCVGYIPSAEELDALSCLAVRQYNAVLGRDADSYFETLNIRSLFCGDYDEYERRVDDLLENDDYDSYYYQFTDLYSRLLADWAYADDPSLTYGSEDEYWDDDFEGEDEETSDDAEPDKPFTPARKGFDNISADFYRTADPLDERLGFELSSSYFYFDYHSDERGSFKPISEGAVPALKELYSSAEADGGKYIEFSADLTDGSETVHIPHVLGWIQYGEYGVSVDFCEWTIYNKDYSVELSDEDAQALIRLGAEQYNAIVTRDAAAYLKTVGLDKSMEGLTAEDILERYDSVELGLPLGFDILLDCASFSDPSLREPFNNDELLAEKYDNDQQNAARVWYEAAAGLYLFGGVTPELLEEMEGDEAIRSELISNYFLSYDYLLSKNGELSPIDAESVYTDEEPYAERYDDGTVSVSMYLCYTSGGEDHFIGRLEGFIKDGVMGVYLTDIIPDGE